MLTYCNQKKRQKNIASVSPLAFLAEKCSPPGHCFLGDGGGAGITGLALSAVSLQLKLKVAAASALVDKVTDSGASTFNGFFKDMMGACNDFSPFGFRDQANLFFRIQAGVKQYFTGIDVANSSNDTAIHQKVFYRPAFSCSEFEEIERIEFFSKWFRTNM